MNIRLFQFLNGDLLIGELVGDGLIRIQIKNPLRVIIVPNRAQPNAGASIGFAPFCEFSEDKVYSFNTSHIVTTMEPVQQFVNQYQQTFGNIMTPKVPLVIPGN